HHCRAVRLYRRAVDVPPLLFLLRTARRGIAAMAPVLLRPSLHHRSLPATHLRLLLPLRRIALPRPWHQYPFCLTSLANLDLPHARDRAVGEKRARLRARTILPLAGMAIGIAIVFFGLDWVGTDYAYLAAYTVLQFVVLATAWNILGGYAGYVNFASAAFFAVGVYTSVINYKTIKLPLIATMPLAAIAAGLLGLGVGYLTLRLRGTFFSIATLALSVVMNTLVVNWAFVGGSRGVYVLRPQTIEFFG